MLSGGEIIKKFSDELYKIVSDEMLWICGRAWTSRTVEILDISKFITVAWMGMLDDVECDRFTSA